MNCIIVRILGTKPGGRRQMAIIRIAQAQINTTVGDFSGNWKLNPACRIAGRSQ